MISLRNEHIGVECLSLVWSETDKQLVACQIHSGDKISLNAIKAEIEKHNNKSGLFIRGDANGWVAGAQHGFINLWSTLEKVNAHGNVLTLLHRNAHDPRMILSTAKKGEEDEPHFYVVARQGDNLRDLFIASLQLALVWPLKVEWADSMVQMGMDNNLIEMLEVGISHELESLIKLQPELKGAAFVSGLRVVTDADRWAEVITSAVQQNFIQI